MTYISALPTPPSRSDDPTGFSNKADALLAALPAFVTEANALSDEVDAMRDDAETKRAATETLRDETVGLKTNCDGIKTDTQYLHDQTVVLKADAQTAASTAQAVAAAYGNEVGLPSLVGHARHALAVNEAENGVEWVQFVKPDSLVILTSGTSWTVPAGVRLARLRMSGGGGGGGRGVAVNYPYGHGACGGYLEALVTLTPGETITYSIGAGGSPGGTDGSYGSAGGATTITVAGVTYTCNGGGGGTVAYSAGGTASGTGSLSMTGIGSAGQGGTNEKSCICPPNPIGRMGGTGVISGETAAAGDSGIIVLELYA